MKLNEISKRIDMLESKVGTPQHFASLVRKYNELNYKEGVAWNQGSIEQHKKIEKQLNHIIQEIAKYYGHLKDADGLKLGKNIGYYDTSNPVSFAKTWLK